GPAHLQPSPTRRSSDLDRQRALLACLLARADHIVTADQLAELVWGEEQPVDPAAALQSQISRLRRAIAPARIETQPPGYLLAARSEEHTSELQSRENRA